MCKYSRLRKFVNRGAIQRIQEKIAIQRLLNMTNEAIKQWEGGADTPTIVEQLHNIVNKLIAIQKECAHGGESSLSVENSIKLVKSQITGLVTQADLPPPQFAAQ